MQNSNPFRKATKTKAKLRLAVMGASGSGKTYSALGIASAFGRIALIDTEHGSASKYADVFTFDTLELTNYHPQKYIDALKAAAGAGYDVVIIDSLSHAWNGVGGVLEIVDKAAAKSDSKNTFAAWRDATPLQQQLVEAMLAVPIHVIVTMRSKMEYILELDKKGKMSPRKVGTAPVQRDGIEYEFDFIGEMNAENELVITKTRVSMLNGETIPQPGKALGESLLAWLQDGVEAPERTETPAGAPAAHSAHSAPQNATQGQERPTPANGSPELTNAGTNGGFEAPDPAPDTDGYRRYLVHEIIVNEMPNGGRQYVAKSEIGDNIVTFGGEAFQAAGYDTSKWFANGKPNRIVPPCMVEAKFIGKKWDVLSVEAGY